MVRDIVRVVDNADNADMLAALLKDDGYRVRVVHGRAPALEQIEEEVPSVVFLHLGPLAVKPYPTTQLYAPDAAGSRAFE